MREIDVRRSGDLTDAELRAMELSENVDRKDLTEIELSRQMDAQAEEVADELRGGGDEVRPRGAEPRGRGWKNQPDSEEKVAAAMGTSRTTIRTAKQHVAAVERYPELEGRSRYEAVVTAKFLDSLPEKRREAMREGAEKVDHRGDQPSGQGWAGRPDSEKKVAAKVVADALRTAADAEGAVRTGAENTWNRVPIAAATFSSESG